MNRSQISFVASVVIILAAVGVGYFFWLGTEIQPVPQSPPAVPTEPPAPREARAVLSRADGLVEVRSRSGEWEAVTEDRELPAGARVRTERVTDEVGVHEQTRGPLRTVRVVARLDRLGRIVLLLVALGVALAGLGLALS